MRHLTSYIHQLPGWPDFVWDEAALAALLAEVRHKQGRLLGRMESLGFALRAEASLVVLTSDVVKTSAIEGERLNPEEVRSSLARRLGLDAAGLAPPGRNVEGIVELMVDATQRFEEPLTNERLFGWHAALFPTGWSNLRRIMVGNWRTSEAGPMRVVSGRVGRERVHFEAPDAHRLESEMARFLGWFNAPPTTDPVLKAALAHFWFVTIHPFEDGNGRIARAIADMALARADGSRDRFYSMSSQIEAERDDYYLQLETRQRNGLDLTLWIEWFLGCLGRSIDRADETLATVVRKARLWQVFNQGPLNDRQRAVINKLIDGFEGALTSSNYAKLTKCSADTALRDIQQLVERGILAQNEGGGRSTSYRLVEPQTGPE